MFTPDLFSGQIVVVTGGGSGIGRCTAHELASLGAHVVVTGRRIEKLETVAAEIGEDGGSASYRDFDIRDEDAVKQAIASIVAEHGRIDLAVYCAGTYRALRATAFDLDVALQHQQVNYVGALVLLDAVLPVLLRQGHGHLSLVGSVAGYRGLPQALAYGPTKAALINLAETLYLDLQPRGIGVSVVNPGFVETPLTADNAFRMPALMSPEEAADAIVRGWQRGAFEIHFPKRFTLWLKALRLLAYGPYFAAVRRSTGA